MSRRGRSWAQRYQPARRRGVNADLGHALVHNLARVDPTDMNVARFFVLCGCRHSANHADRLTMRISRCRTRGNGDETGRGAVKGRSCRACGDEEDGLQRASMGSLSRAVSSIRSQWQTKQ
jgi:hypothetical protein